MAHHAGQNSRMADYQRLWEICMADNRGAKAGWSIGWFGAIIWIPITATKLFFHDYRVIAIIGFICFSISLACVLFFVPWKFPRARMWKLVLPLYAFTLVYVAALISVNPYGEELRWSMILLLAPVFMPLFILGQRRWCDVATQHGDSAEM